jgi:DHA2 family multidrug resistance protein
MINNPTPVFKFWVPEWLVKVTIFLVVLPSMGLFGLSNANSAVAVGFYGFEPTDIQYSMVIFYAAVASFFALERRFFNFVAIKEYMLISAILQIATSYVCYITHNLQVLLVFRFLQGMANCATTSICITLIFNRLKSERAREIGYSIFYGMLLCISQFTLMVTSPVIDAYDYNVLYKAIIFLYLPGTFMLFFMLNNIRLSKRFPLYQIDWASFVIYASALCLIGYVLVYGQQYDWFDDPRIVRSTFGILLLLTIHVLRQRNMKRPYLTLKVFQYRNFKIGALLVFVLYICRGAMGITNNYFGTVLGMDPTHTANLLLINSAGIILSVIISSRFVILQRPMRFIWMAGFIFLLAFHLYMRLLFSTQANVSEFYIPLFLQGMGAGTLMTPIIIFMVSSVPGQLGGTASATGVFFRFCGFCSSIALINYFSISKQSEHLNRFQQSLSALDPTLVQKLNAYRQMLIGKGIAPDRAGNLANVLLSRSVHTQTQLRYAMDYYELISWIILGIIMLIALYPYINRTIVNVKANQPASASF